MSVVIRKVLPEEVAELKVISEDTFRETLLMITLKPSCKVTLTLHFLRSSLR